MKSKVYLYLPERQVKKLRQRGQTDSDITDLFYSALLRGHTQETSIFRCMVSMASMTRRRKSILTSSNSVGMYLKYPQEVNPVNTEYRVKHLPSKVTKESRTKFYRSSEWKRLRYEAFLKYGRTCNCCGRGSEESPLQVDHIKPISLHWNLRNNLDNLQILCKDCNEGKSNVYDTDFRAST